MQMSRREQNRRVNKKIEYLGIKFLVEERWKERPASRTIEQSSGLFKRLCVTPQ